MLDEEQEDLRKPKAPPSSDEEEHDVPAKSLN
jgi:hypothetical protein